MKKTNKIKNYSLKAARIGKKKKVKGFTLVELIVVIAIIGVLAVVLVPNMMGRVKDARLTTANDAAAKIAEQTRIAMADLDAAGKSYTTYFGGATADATSLSTSSSNELEKAVANACPETQNANYVAVSVSADGSKVAVIYQEKENSAYIGLYPKPDDYKYDKNMTTTTYTISGGQLTKGSSTPTPTPES